MYSQVAGASRAFHFRQVFQEGRHSLASQAFREAEASPGFQVEEASQDSLVEEKPRGRREDRQAARLHPLRLNSRHSLPPSLPSIPAPSEAAYIGSPIYG